MSATLAISEDAIFDAVWQTVTQLFDAPVAEFIFKGAQNMTSTPPGVSYIVLSPGVRTGQDQGRRQYDSVAGLQIVEKHRTYFYQIDCYGPNAPDWADTLSAAWQSPWVADYAADNALPFAPLYADEAQQLNITNGENQYEQRFMTRLFVQVNQSVALPQDFFADPGPITVYPPADNLVV